MRTAYCPKTHRELSRTSVGVEFGHVPGHNYNDVDVVISQSRDGKFRCHIVESWGSAQGYDEEHGRREAIGRGESISEAAHDAKQIALEAGVSTRYLTSAVSKAIDEALEATQPTEVSLLTPDNCGASQIACNIVNNTFLSLDGFESMRKQMAGTDYTAEHFGAELARIVDREVAAKLMLDANDESELFYAFKSRGSSDTQRKVAKFLRDLDSRKGRTTPADYWYTETNAVNA